MWRFGNNHVDNGIFNSTCSVDYRNLNTGHSTPAIPVSSLIPMLSYFSHHANFFHWPRNARVMIDLFIKFTLYLLVLKIKII